MWTTSASSDIDQPANPTHRPEAIGDRCAAGPEPSRGPLPRLSLSARGAAGINDTIADNTLRLNDDCPIVTAQLPNGGQTVLEVPTEDEIDARIATTPRPYEAIDLGLVDVSLRQSR